MSCLRFKLRFGILLIFAVAVGGCASTQETPAIPSTTPAPQQAPTNQPNIIVITPTQSTGLLLPTPGTAFCDDPRVQIVLTDLITAIKEKNGPAFGSLIDPVDGLDIYYTSASLPVNISLETARDLFDSTVSFNWGDHPGSGLPVEGTFSVEILPLLLDVMDRTHTKTCQNLENGIGTGPTTAVITWPEKHSGMQFIALFRAPGPQDNELDWRTWAVGFSMVNGEPKIRMLVQYFWEI